MILHLIRHPRPLIAPGVCYGRLDVAAVDPAPLAAALKARLPSDLPLWCSPLARCRPLAGALAANPQFDERLAEMDFGDWEGRPWSAIPRHEIDAWAADVAHYAPPGGESPASLQARALAFVASLTVPEAVLVTHAGVIRVLLAAWRDLPPAVWSSLVFDYGSLTTVHVPR